MATKTYKLIDLFRGFYVLYIADPARGPYPDEESKLNVLVNLLAAQLIIVNSDKAPENIPVPFRNFFPRFLEILYHDRKAVRHVCEKVIKFYQDRTLVDRKDILLHSHIRKIIEQLSDGETIDIEMGRIEMRSTLSVKKKISCEVAIPLALERRFLDFFMKILEERGYYLSGFSSIELIRSKITIDAIKEGEEDKLYSLLEKFAREYNLLIEPRADEKLTFGDLKSGDIFIDFPTPGDNSGHGGYLGEYYSYVKIDEDEDGNNAERATNPKMRSHFLPSVLILKIA